MQVRTLVGLKHFALKKKPHGKANLSLMTTDIRYTYGCVQLHAGKKENQIFKFKELRFFTLSVSEKLTKNPKVVMFVVHSSPVRCYTSVHTSIGYPYSCKSKEKIFLSQL